MESRLESVFGGWEIVRTGRSRHIGKTGRINRDAETKISTEAFKVAVAAEKGRVNQGSAAGVQFRDEAVAVGSTNRGLERTGSGREIARVGPPSDIGRIRRIDRDAIGRIAGSAAQVS